MRAFLGTVFGVFAAGLMLAAPTSAETEVKMGISVPDAAALLVYVAQDKGFYKAEGLDSQLVQFESDTAAAQALTAGAVQLNCASIFPVLDAYVAGRDLVAVWGLSNQPVYVWYGPAKYQSVTDIKGGKVGVSSIGSMTYHISSWAVARSGLDPNKDVTFVALGGPLNRVQALRAGQVDLIPATAPGLFLLEQEGYKPLLALDKYMPQFSYETFYARKSQLNQNADLIKAVIRGTIHAKHWAMSHQAEAAEVLRARLGGPDTEKEIYRKTVALDLPYFPDDGTLPADSLNVFLGFYKDQGKIKEVPPLAAYTDFRFIDYFKEHPVRD